MATKNALLFSAGLALTVFSGFATAAADELIDFPHQIVPILKTHCVECHGGSQAKGGFSLNTRALFLENAAAIPGDPDSSDFYLRMLSDDEDLMMPPPDHPRVPAASLALIRKWIDQGLKWEPGFTFAESTYEPPLLPRHPEIPAAHAGRTHPIDRFIDAWLLERELPIPEPIDDETFLRRSTLDLIGLLPTPGERDEFLADSNPDKRTRWIEHLLERRIDYADHWMTFWNDLLRNDYTGTGFITGGRKQISTWLYSALLENRPYDEFVRELIAPKTGESRGFIDGIKWRGEVSAGQTLEIQFSQSISQSFLGINMKCASCHDSFIDRWTLKEAYSLAAIYAEAPLEIHRCDKPTGEQATAGWIFPELGSLDASLPREQRLEQLSKLMTDPRNGRFTRTIVNRLWHQLMGRGLVHPVDAMQTEPWHADLLDYLANYLVEHDYDLKQLLRHITTSQAYQSQTEVIQATEDGEYVYRGPRARRLTAEQFLDAVWQLTDAPPAEVDAPVLRNAITEEEREQIALQGSWIWGASAQNGGVPPAGETIMLRKTFQLDSVPNRAVAAVTCDNSAIIYVNGREVSRVDNWEKPAAIVFESNLKPGRNDIVVRATNAGTTPNAAGLYFEARLLGPEGQETVIVSDGSWQWNPQLNQPREGRMGGLPGTFEPAVVVPALSVWTDRTRERLQNILAAARLGEDPLKARASLLNNNALMTALGRPNRDQIVTSRPQELTTLEAINLANGEQLMQALEQGARDLQSRYEGEPERLIEHVYQFALSRNPTAAERELLLNATGPEPTVESIQDLLWIVCLSPEFVYVR
ncbi:DUF1549 domain-containing protein [Rubinisphaera margarita]|uniref:DUF1549 domain-containing protein n=1 Tax=Rubinisphaera margarita TaxID=2909586 RepID=UPI001EE8C10B|nr:DUF1549 domain-containing protein [Rubinisphaera margarita]MCG6157784.1 PSD1 and planctomycete cytochrome C domain-containing protein [Rubinisphaera margarita]